MGSVIDYEACPSCKGVMMVDFYYRTGEEYQFCQRCGYHHSREMKRDDNNKVLLIQKDGKEVPIWIETQAEGFGTYRIMNTKGVGQCGGFNEPVTGETIEEFKGVFEQEDVDGETSYLMRFENGKVEVLLGNPDDRNLLSFDELHKKTEEERPEELTL